MEYALSIRHNQWVIKRTKNQILKATLQIKKAIKGHSLRNKIEVQKLKILREKILHHIERRLNQIPEEYCSIICDTTHLLLVEDYK